jgi:hypothetical protein
MDRIVYVLRHGFGHCLGVGFGVRVFYAFRCILGSWLYNADNI